MEVAIRGNRRSLDHITHRDHNDRPLPAKDPFHHEVRLLLAPRSNPAQRPGPRGNPPIDKRAVARVARMMHTIVG